MIKSNSKWKKDLSEQFTIQLLNSAPHQTVDGDGQAGIDFVMSTPQYDEIPGNVVFPKTLHTFLDLNPDGTKNFHHMKLETETSTNQSRTFLSPRIGDPQSAKIVFTNTGMVYGRSLFNMDNKGDVVIACWSSLKPLTSPGRFPLQ